MGNCKWVDEEIIELHAMGRIQDYSVCQHLDCCTSCVARVREARLFIDKLKRGLRSLQEGSGHHREANDDHSNRQDGS
jgi:hypothetical protein